ncbi:hypothetical protein [Pseudonocardia sp. NPDC049635]|uniref:hypothetical protein n=1 Tax=Pseudonocardia sp. NPDC049635 TaxID=3155506 RepID=UPI0033D0ED99
MSVDSAGFGEPRQRTVAELLAANGGSQTGRRRRRRASEDDEPGGAPAPGAGGGVPAAPAEQAPPRGDRIRPPGPLAEHPSFPPARRPDPAEATGRPGARHGDPFVPNGNAPNPAAPNPAAPNPGAPNGSHRGPVNGAGRNGHPPQAVGGGAPPVPGHRPNGHAPESYRGGPPPGYNGPNGAGPNGAGPNGAGRPEEPYGRPGRPDDVPPPNGRARRPDDGPGPYGFPGRLDEGAGAYAGRPDEGQAAPQQPVHPDVPAGRADPYPADSYPNSYAGYPDEIPTSRLGARRPAVDPDDGGPPTQFGAPPLDDGEDVPTGRTRPRPAVVDDGPPTGAYDPFADEREADFDGDRTGVLTPDRGELWDDGPEEHDPQAPGHEDRDAGEASRGRRGRRRVADEDEGPDGAEPPAGLDDEADAGAAGTGQAWAVVIAQWIGGAVAGAAIWVLFRFLWFSFPIVALASAVVLTVGLVLGVRALLRNDDLKTTLFAVLVGLLLTVSPALLVLLDR